MRVIAKAKGQAYTEKEIVRPVILETLRWPLN
jgi:hypothetical protein